MPSRFMTYRKSRCAIDPEYKLRLNQKATAARKRLRLRVIEEYGGCCACCGENEILFLVIDHVNGGGNADRKANHLSSIYYRIQREGYPPTYQVLCHNCNSAKSLYGVCPHQGDGHGTKDVK